MKVAFVTHQLSFNYFGGMEVQMLRTKEHLEKLDVDVKFFDMWNDKIEDFDILHIFGPAVFGNEAYNFIVTARERNVKTIVSSIYWFSLKYHRMQSLKKRIFFHKLLFPLTRKVFGYFRSIEKVFRMADMVLPNSRAEAILLKRLFGLDDSKIRVVHNAVDSLFKYGNQALFERKLGLEDFILFVGRIEDRKNVLNLIRAFRETDLDTNLVLIGRSASQKYLEMCKREADKRVVFLGPMKHEDPMLLSAYKACKVVALPSYYETPGLTALEGALAGANIMVTAEGSAREYFGDYAWYVDPYNFDSIVVNLIRAYEAPKNTVLSTIVEENFTWEKVAEKTLQAYEEII